LEYLWESTSVAACSTAGFLAVLYRLMISFVAVDCVAFIAFLVEAAVFLATVYFSSVPSNTIFVEIKLNYNWQIGHLSPTPPYFSSEEFWSTSIPTAVDA